VYVWKYAKKTEMLISTPSCHNPSWMHPIHRALYRPFPFHFHFHLNTQIYRHYAALYYTVLYCTILYYTAHTHTYCHYAVHTDTYCTALSCIVRTSMHSCWHQELELVRPVERIRPGVSVMEERERERGRRDRA
jgi:hypothetical protein